MIIKELYIAEFGGIKNRKIEFGDNRLLNIIYGENESGKSTIFLFIKLLVFFINLGYNFGGGYVKIGSK